jgi:iron(III) transport system permease protein
MSDAATATAEDRGPKKGIDWFPYMMGGLTFVILLFLFLYPMLKTLLASFIKSGSVMEFSTFDPTKLTLYNFQRFFEPGIYVDAFWHSIMIGGWTTLISTLIALPAAYAVARVEMPFRNLILSLSVIPLIAPPFIGSYSWIILLGRQGIITQYVNQWFDVDMPTIYGPFGIILALSLHFFPFVFLFVQGALAAADPFIEESAEIMGGRRWQIVRTITMPLVLPSIGAGALIILVRAFGNFGVPAILGGDYYVLPTLLYQQIHGYFDLNAAAAIAFVNVLITLVAILFLARVNRRRRFVTVTSVTRAAKKLNGLGAKIAANIYVWGLLAIALLPNFVIVFTSFAEKWIATIFPTEYGFDNYVLVFSELSQPIINSLILGSWATLLCVVFGTLAGYTSVRRRFHGKWVLDLTIMLPFILPGIVTGVAFLTSFNKTGLITLTGTGTILVLAYFTRRLAYIFRSVTAAIGQVDVKMEEASIICGATWGRTMGKITVPLIAPGILAGGILVFTTLLNDLNATIMLYTAPWKTISVSIFEHLINDDLAAASTIGAIAIMLALTLVFGASKLIGKSMADMFR